MYPPLSHVILQARRRRGWNQQRLSRRSGVAQSVISRIERGEVTDPAHSTVVELLRALGVSWDVTSPPTLCPGDGVDERLPWSDDGFGDVDAADVLERAIARAWHWLSTGVAEALEGEWAEIERRGGSLAEDASELEVPEARLREGEPAALRGRELVSRARWAHLVTDEYRDELRDRLLAIHRLGGAVDVGDVREEEIEAVSVEGRVQRFVQSSPTRLTRLLSGSGTPVSVTVVVDEGGEYRIAAVEGR